MTGGHWTDRRTKRLIGAQATALPKNEENHRSRGTVINPHLCCLITQLTLSPTSGNNYYTIFCIKNMTIFFLTLKIWYLATFDKKNVIFFWGGSNESNQEK